MKTFWTEQVVNQNADKAGFANSQEYLTAKVREFERNSGVKWSVSHGGGGYRFDPVDDGMPIANTVSDDDLEAIRFACRVIDSGMIGYVTYLIVSEESGISLRRLMPIVKWMEKKGMARRTVNRMGKGYAFKLV
jgi:hypothetical protein